MVGAVGGPGDRQLPSNFGSFSHGQVVTNLPTSSIPNAPPQLGTVADQGVPLSRNDGGAGAGDVTVVRQIGGRGVRAL